MLLVRDAAGPNHPVIGIAALASSAVQLGVRDSWIGWVPEEQVERLRTTSTDEDINWLIQLIDGGIKDLYLDDLFDPHVGPLRPTDLLAPTVQIVRWLNDYADIQRAAHHRNSDSRLHKADAGKSLGGASHWRRQAETPLFRSKRAETLSVYLRAKTVLFCEGKRVSPAVFQERLRSPEARQGIQSLIRRAKSERVGVAMADISVCGAVPPYPHYFAES
jgi:hypothetical protein